MSYQPIQVIIEPDKWVLLKVIAVSFFAVLIYKLGVHDRRMDRDEKRLLERLDKLNGGNHET